MTTSSSCRMALTVCSFLDAAFGTVGAVRQRPSPRLACRRFRATVACMTLSPFDLRHPAFARHRLVFAFSDWESAKRAWVAPGAMERLELLAAVDDHTLSFTVDSFLSALGSPAVAPSTLEQLVPLATVLPPLC